MKERTNNAIVTMGSNILVGIILTKFFGVLILYFASSILFRLYYFRMYISIVFVGFFYAMFFVPLCLRYLGLKNEGPRDVKSS